MVSLLWLIFAGQQDFERTILVPVETQNLPVGMEVVAPLDPRIQITVRGLRKDASVLSERNVLARIDLSMSKYGRRVFPVTSDQILLPNERVQVVKIEPSALEFKFKGEP